MLKNIAEIWDRVRSTTPLVHCITNYVTVNDVANTILACGASPAMAEHPEEAEGFARIANALYLNLGTLGSEQAQAMRMAVQGASAPGVPIIIDPVACGVIPRKMEIINELSQFAKFTCIKGNSAEIKSLAGLESLARGVDSLDQGEGLEEACRAYAEREKVVVAATGKVDVVTEGNKLALIKNGTSLFGAITGAGCMVGGVVAACIGAVPAEPWLACTAGLVAFNIAGERAEYAGGNNPGSFRSLLFDHLYHLRGEDLLQAARVEWKS